MVEVEIVEKEDLTMRLIVQGVSVTFLNTLRRIVLGEIPSMAIDEAVVIENSSPLHDEILVHRLGLIPLTTDLDTYNLPEDCPCKSELGCNLCRAVLTLDFEAVEGVKTVYSRNLVSENPDIKPVRDNIPIAKLASNQKIRLEAYARLGRGKTHAKWQPVSMCTYQNLPKIKIDANRCDACGKCVEVCFKGILAKVGKSIETRNIIQCALCEDCVDACPQSPPAIDVTWDQNSFVFNVESTGALPVGRILMEALKILDKKFLDFQDTIKEVL